MKPLNTSRMADEIAAIDQLRKKPSWRATQLVNGASTKQLRRRARGYLPLWTAAVLLLCGLLATSLIWRPATHDHQALFPGQHSHHQRHWHKPFSFPDFVSAAPRCLL